MKRIVENELMIDEDQVLAFNNAQRDHSYNAFIYWFRKLGISTGTVVDFGSGPANHLIKLSKEFPNLKLIGIDGSSQMINIAKRNVDRENLTNRISFICKTFDKISELDCECIMSLGTLHHLHDPAIFWNAIKKNSKSGTSIFVMDLLRPNTEQQVKEAIESLCQEESDLYKSDFSNSLHAAFKEDEISDQLLEAGLDLSIHSHENIIKIIFVHGTI